jgi:hypothetical protein
MSTKNLARTVIEGGRHKHNKWDRHNSHAENRAAVRNYIKEVTLDPENFDEYDVEPVNHVGKSFDDKLGPIYRWLRAQIGRPWDDVRAEISQTFDIRTTAGRHIVFDHLYNSVHVGPEPQQYYYRLLDDPDTTSYSRNDFYVDNSGILQEKRYINRRFNRGVVVPPFDTKKIANWLSGRIVGKVGNKYFWFIPVTGDKKHGGTDYTWKIEWRTDYPYGYSYETRPVFSYLTYDIIYKTDSLGLQILEDGRPIILKREPKWRKTSTPSLRQGRKLNTKDMDFWNTLPEYYRTKVLECSPNYPNPPKYDYWGHRIS